MPPKKRASPPVRRRGLLPLLLAGGAAVVVIAVVLNVRFPALKGGATEIGARDAAPAPAPVSTPAPQTPVQDPAAVVSPPGPAEAPSGPPPPAPALSDLPPLPPGTPVRPRDVVAAVHTFAARRPDILRHVPCFCGCEQTGHKGNDDCFVKRRDAHGRVVEWEPHGMT